MRIIADYDNENKMYAVIKISYIGYDEDLHINESRIVSGLHIVDINDDSIVIVGVSKEDCNYICSKLYEYGYCDLREFGEIEYI